MGKGKELSKTLGIDCQQALYSEWGNFYAAITKYPCALFDKAGFIVIGSPDELDKLGIRVGKRTNIPHHISSLPIYQLVAAWRVQVAEEIAQEEPRLYAEGAVARINVNRYERDREARNKCIAHYGCVCQACGLKMSYIYGKIAENFIHIHHVTPISKVGATYILDPVQDLKPLCPNCHAVAHLRKEPYTIEEIQTAITNKT